jgi:hypothetical protein
MCVLAKVDALSLWKNNRPRALVVSKISAIKLLESFRKLVSQFPPPVWLGTDHSIQVTKPPPNHTLNTYITFAELF